MHSPFYSSTTHPFKKTIFNYLSDQPLFVTQQVSKILFDGYIDELLSVYLAKTKKISYNFGYQLEVPKNIRADNYFSLMGNVCLK